ncbi:DODA-type extradiol aromatic ring-opening family dioxygenase [Alicyclobacillus suci]|uniref:DODA-type extradiol aromatic ring-opening family dioxygenase n=1 Tax=Alicyclobacillus suci TaxID=2816080 RepID=UPI001CB7ACA8|nr:class III extradiol ring-cleavage dioxygenase [Alicyclobacillus suci]
MGQTLPRPSAVILFSAHWVTGVQQVSGVTEYDTIYDFGGFPDELYQIRYPAKGDRQIAHRIAERLMKDGIASEVDPTRGLGHGAWIILRLLLSQRVCSRYLHVRQPSAFSGATGHCNLTNG